jgi:hypothetical protein
MSLFKVKTKIIQIRKPGKPPESKPMSSWMVAEKEYPVFDVMKYRTKTEDGTYHINTLFLVADATSGRMDWVDASILLYLGEGNESKSPDVGEVLAG